MPYVGDVNLSFERLRISTDCSILCGGGKTHTMLHVIDTPTYLTEAAFAASVLCWQSVDTRRNAGHALALAGRDAR